MKFSTLRNILIVLALMTVVAVPVCALSGSGTSADPYLVATADDLMQVSGSGYYKQTQDITLNDVTLFKYENRIATAADGATSWTPKNFSGSYDGDNKYITGLYVTDSVSEGGLFGTLTNATIKNVVLDFALVESDVTAGILAAKATGSTNISGCVVSGSVIGKTTKTMNTTGGLVGIVEKDATVTGSASYATVTGATSYSANVGGVVGANFGTVTASAFEGKVYGTATYYDAAIGGIVGYNAGEVSNCRTKGTVGGESTAKINDCYVGGIVGVDKGEMYNCENNAAVSVENNSPEQEGICAAGGIAGVVIDVNLSSCTNNGALTGKYAYLGGIAGVAVADNDYKYIEYCDNTGSVSCLYGVAGGIVGRAAAAGEGYVSIKLYIIENYNTGEFVGSAKGEICGETVNVESATVIATAGTGANGNSCSAKKTVIITANQVQYGPTIQSTTSENVSVKITGDTLLPNIKVIRCRPRGTFIPNPVWVDYTKVKDAGLPEIIKLDASDLKYEGGRLAGTVYAEVYTPNASTVATFVMGSSVGAKFAHADFETVAPEIGTRIDKIEITVDVEVVSSGDVNVTAMLVGNTDNMNPLCESKKFPE